MKGTAITSQIELPCTVLFGQDGELKLSGTAIRIESARMVLRIPGSEDAAPHLGDEVQLNVHLPAEAQGIAAKDLSARGRIIEVSQMGDDVRTCVLSFRRAQFKDRNGESAPPKRRVSSSSGWEM